MIEPSPHEAALERLAGSLDLPAGLPADTVNHYHPWEVAVTQETATLASICEMCFQDWCESCPHSDPLGGSCCCGNWDASNDEDEDDLW